MSWSTYKTRMARARDKDRRLWLDEVGPLLTSIAASAVKANEAGDLDGLDTWLDDIETEVGYIRKALAERDRALASEGGP